jgi:hypothetical protein
MYIYIYAYIYIYMFIYMYIYVHILYIYMDVNIATWLASHITFGRHNYSFGESWFEYVCLCCCASSLPSECLVVLSLSIRISNSGSPWFQKCLPRLEDLCSYHSVANVHFICFSFARPRKPWFEDVFVDLKICVQTTQWPMYASFPFRLHNLENTGLKIRSLI